MDGVGGNHQVMSHQESGLVLCCFHKGRKPRTTRELTRFRNLYLDLHTTLTLSEKFKRLQRGIIVSGEWVPMSPSERQRTPLNITHLLIRTLIVVGTSLVVFSEVLVCQHLTTVGLV